MCKRYAALRLARACADNGHFGTRLRLVGCIVRCFFDRIVMGFRNPTLALCFVVTSTFISKADSNENSSTKELSQLLVGFNRSSIIYGVYGVEFIEIQ